MSNYYELEFIQEEIENLLNNDIKKLVIYLDNRQIEVYNELSQKINQYSLNHPQTQIALKLTDQVDGDAAVLSEIKADGTIMVLHGTVKRGEKHNHIMLNYDAVYEYHKQTESVFTMVLGDIKHSDPTICTTDPEKLPEEESYGTALLEGRYVKDFKKRKPKNETEYSFADIGVSLFESEVLALIQETIKKPGFQYLSFTKLPEKNLAVEKAEEPIIKQLLDTKRKVAGYSFSGKWFHFRRYKKRIIL
ncbi:MAG: hypothetical protein GF308_13440 [Candidatus Heimdallarchaeota archaeon]|nr:hypothetical protein [Candidatus Heimdallarchaeota archaeon]